MRTMGLLVTCVTAWAISLGVTATLPGLVTVPTAGEISQCLIPMRNAVPPLVPCSDRTPAWSAPEQPPDPQWTARLDP